MKNYLLNYLEFVKLTFADEYFLEISIIYLLFVVIYALRNQINNEH